MAAHSTRMLLLGAVAIFGPVNGYQIRRELGSWNVDEWANLGPGSIYSGLSTLVRLGHLVRHDLDDGGRVVAVYEITADGRGELARLLGHGLETVNLGNAVPWHAALVLIHLLDRPVALRHLEVRREVLVHHVEAQLAHPAGSAPPHAERAMRLWAQVAQAELRWLEETLVEIREGALDFAGEPWSWRPADDDPGYEMVAERQRYRVLLDGRRP